MIYTILFIFFVTYISLDINKINAARRSINRAKEDSMIRCNNCEGEQCNVGLEGSLCYTENELQEKLDDDLYDLDGQLIINALGISAILILTLYLIIKSRTPSSY